MIYSKVVFLFWLIGCDWLIAWPTEEYHWHWLVEPADLFVLINWCRWGKIRDWCRLQHSHVFLDHSVMPSSFLLVHFFYLHMKVLTLANCRYVFFLNRRILCTEHKFPVNVPYGNTTSLLFILSKTLTIIHAACCNDDIWDASQVVASFPYPLPISEFRVYTYL